MASSAKRRGTGSSIRARYAIARRRREARSQSTWSAYPSVARSPNSPRGPQRSSAESAMEHHSDSGRLGGTGSVSSRDPRRSVPSVPAEGVELDDAALDTLDEAVMAVNLTNRGALGCAYYLARTETLYFMEDLNAADTSIIDSLKLFIDPTIVLVPANCAANIIERLDPDTAGPGETDDHVTHTDPARLSCLFESRPSSEFKYEASRNKLVDLRIGQKDGPGVTFAIPGDIVSNTKMRVHDVDGAAAETSRQGELLRLAAWINTDSKLTVGCAGAILAYLQRRRAAAYLPGDESTASVFRVACIEMFTLADSLFINCDTLYSLQIISTESHPNAHQQGPASRGWSLGGAKEGLSVYGLFHQLARTSQGRTLLRRYFLRPSMNLGVIEERHATIDALLRPENNDCLVRLGKSLSRIKNMRLVTVSLRKGVSSVSTRGGRLPNSIWSNTRHFVFHALQITDILSELVGGERLDICCIIGGVFDKRRLAEVGALIGGIVDLEASQEQQRTVVLPSVDSELDEFRRTYEGLDDLLSQVAEHVADSVPAELDAKINVIFFPQIGFLVSLRLDPATGCGVYEGIDDDQWERMFVTEATSYYKNTITTDLDREYGDMYGQMCDREIEIIHGLCERILEYEDLLNAVSDVCGELDCLTALAKGAAQYNLSRPRMSENNVLVIKGGRHILQEVKVPAFVANDTDMEGGNGMVGRGTDPRGNPAGSLGESNTKMPGMLILTGPNYSGKSIYLKQVAIITYMAHIGSFVPAETAEIGLTDKILTRISTRESVSRMQSAFMIDLQQISLALNLATRRSLLVIDEFGKGTQATDGAGLAAGVFEHLLSRGAEMPKVLSATHLHEIFEGGFLMPRAGLNFGHMEVKVDPDAAEVERQVTYLYTYRPGRSTKSFGAYCAAMNGVAPAIVQRAEALGLLAAKSGDLVEACAPLPKAELVELEAAENVARSFLAADLHGDPRTLLHDLLDAKATPS